MPLPEWPLGTSRTRARGSTLSEAALDRRGWPRSKHPLCMDRKMVCRKAPTATFATRGKRSNTIVHVRRKVGPMLFTPSLCSLDRQKREGKEEDRAFSSLTITNQRTSASAGRIGDVASFDGLGPTFCSISAIADGEGSDGRRRSPTVRRPFPSKGNDRAEHDLTEKVAFLIRSCERPE